MTQLKVQPAKLNSSSTICDGPRARLVAKGKAGKGSVFSVTLPHTVTEPPKQQ